MAVGTNTVDQKALVLNVFAARLQNNLVTRDVVTWNMLSDEMDDRNRLQVIEQRSGGDVRFKVASLYPLLYRLERRGWISGQWVEKEGQRRRRYYRLTREGRKVLAEQRQGWQRFVAAIGRITEVGNA